MNQAIESDPSRPDTKERILDAAEKLFADNGFSATSLRRITTEASVNLAAVNYHFRSKDELVKAVLMRKMVPLNDERIKRLERLEASTVGRVSLEAVLDCLIRPVFEARKRRELCRFPRFMGRVFMEPGDWVQKITQPALAPMLARFTPALCRALPGTKHNEVVWGLFFGIGSFVHTLVNRHAIPVLATGLETDVMDEDAVADRVIRFVAAGMRGLASSESIQGEVTQ